MVSSMKKLDYTDAQSQRLSLDVSRAKESDAIGVVVSISSTYQMNQVRLIRNTKGSLAAKAVFDSQNNLYFAVYTKEPPADGSRSQHFLHKYNSNGNYPWTKNLVSFCEASREYSISINPTSLKSSFDANITLAPNPIEGDIVLHLEQAQIGL